MIVAVPQETYPGERRVALIPAALAPLTKAGLEIVVQSGAGLAAGFSDAQYTAKGARVVTTREEAFAADVVLQVRAAGANPQAGQADLKLMRAGQVIIGHVRSAGHPAAGGRIGRTGAALFALELLPRITRAQSMDVLSSQATIAGYRAVLLAAGSLAQNLPHDDHRRRHAQRRQGVRRGGGRGRPAGHRYGPAAGGSVSAYDVRPAVKEQVQSLGAKFVEMPPGNRRRRNQGRLRPGRWTKTFYRSQRELMARVVAESDVVITTAAVPGKKAPVLVTADDGRRRWPPAR